MGPGEAACQGGAFGCPITYLGAQTTAQTFAVGGLDVEPGRTRRDGHDGILVLEGLGVRADAYF